MHMWKHPQISNNLSQSPSVTVYSWHKTTPLPKVVLYVNQRSSIYLETCCIMMERVLLLLGLVVLHTSYTVSIHSAFLGRLKRRDWMFTRTSWCVCVFCRYQFPLKYTVCAKMILERLLIFRDVERLWVKSVCVTEVYENGEDENPILNLGEICFNT